MMTLLAFANDALSEDIDHKLAHETPTLRAKVTPSDEAIGGDDDAPVVKVCSGCMRSAPNDAEFCPACGSDLVSIRRVPDMYLDESVGGKYRIVEKIGQGGMGVVYLALNDELGQKVAVKFLSKKFAGDENLVLRFLNEAKSYCRVNHPNAVTLLDYGQHDDGALFIITEFIQGKNVTETLQDLGPLSEETVLDLGIQIAQVLSAAHSQGVIHRDLKPDNIMLMPLSRGRYAVKVLDFGIAKIVDEEDGPNTETGSVFGTPEFMSPEQARGDEADPRSDIYALGVILFYMVTGRLPFRGKNKLVVLNMQLNDPAPRPSTVSPDADITPRFESVIMKCLNKGREQRYADADDLVEALEELRVPGGLATGKVGVARGTTATPMLNSADVHGHADTLASPLDDGPKFTELESVELWREAETARATPDRTMSMTPVVVLVLLAVAVAGYISASQEAAPKEALPDTIALSQKDALVATIDSMISHGDLGEARTTIEHAPKVFASDLEALDKRVADLGEKRGRFDAAVSGHRCDDAAAIADDVSALSQGLSKVLRKEIDVCRATPTKGKSEVVEAALPEKVVKPVTRKPKPKAKPIKPKIAPPPNVDVQPDPPKDVVVPDDMSLPPRTLEDDP